MEDHHDLFTDLMWYISANEKLCTTACAPYGGFTGATMTGATYNGVVYDQICACNK